MIRSLVLDWAGTLADDQALTLEATNATLTSLGGEPVDMGTYRNDFVVPVMGFYGPRLPGRTLEEIDAVFFAEYRARLDRVPLFPGAAELLYLARVRNVPVTILTTLRAADVETILRAHDLRFLVGDIHGEASDKREVLPRIIVASGVSADETLYVGDTVHDVETALHARVRAGAAAYGYTPEASLRAAGADHVFEAPEQIGQKLDREYLLDELGVVIATVGGLILDAEGRILLVKTRKWSGTWGIPGGKIDYGETMEAAYVREIAEETGLAIRDTQFVMIQDCIESPEFERPRHFLLANFISRTDEPERLRLNYEIDDSAWVHPDELDRYRLNEPTRLLFEEIERRGLLAAGDPT